MKHTPGPWIRDKSSGVRCDVRAENGRKVALCWGLSGSKGAMTNSAAYREECDANAHLIAAAPDLFKALQHLVHWHDQLSAKDIAMAKEALAKAGVSA